MKVLVLGAGQLAKMLYLAAAPLGVEVFAVDVTDNSVLNPVSRQVHEFDLAFAIEEAKAITVEFEHIPEPLLELVEASGKLMPNMLSIMAGADRVREKYLLAQNGIANCQHLIIDNVDQLEGITDILGDKIIFKSSRDGYDGYGQWRMRSASDLGSLHDTFDKLDLRKVPLIAEKMSLFDREISVVGARDAKGNICCFQIAENLHYEGQLHVSIAPATKLTKTIIFQANDIFKRIANALEYVGVLAIELFQVGDELLVNEIAPRVHNSGHWTQDGVGTCQFEQHIRAVLGFGLGSTKTPYVNAMVNVIGCTSFSRDLIALDGCHLHWYGKTLREKRKMGHINVVADNYAQLGDKLIALLEHLPEESFPLLAGEAKRLQAFSQT
ncbi:5-(carboxyamino)imidazole ribonucleotide synthase [Glaciecola punicea ACAM 611]|uniref:N5-carboxyaminoimidazole ribonucleotide synthase n=1 Tax=Glaciecola punicea ACAM 611 TaxID=1121923 RepID=H5TFE5_9ALTE|nr:5-(carboxyamino)imidazole ribonucleotide synthase [Glaciecola punicea]OFA32637.1 5-(carboxyamino)imidazole ribonucleotide synthase [Glaciecola punicea]GAB56825.1 5-(carboxyamino)imidazole ribonucleotide synthase [Glaciecola punicea ACAM 611]